MVCLRHCSGLNFRQEEGVERAIRKITEDLPHEKVAQKKKKRPRMNTVTVFRYVKICYKEEENNLFSLSPAEK